VQNLVDDNPALLESIDWYVSQLARPEPAATKADRPKRKTTVDPMPFRRRAREVLRDAVRDWEYGRDDDDIGYEIGGLIENALKFLDHGDVPNAMVALQGITEGCADGWHIIDDFVGLTPQDVNVDLDSAWAEVLLSADLTDDETLEWQEQLEAWQDQLDSFAMAMEALRQGWDYPPLVRVFEGHITEKGAWSTEAPNWADDFAQIRLRILARQERYEDYLLLAEAEGQTKEYLTMLGQLGRTDQAMAAAQQQLATLDEARALAETLRAQNKLDQALTIALQGLRLDQQNPYAMYDFATWTGDMAESMGNPEAALEARVIGFKARPSFQDYQKIRDLAGTEWPGVKAQLLNRLRAKDLWGIEQAQVDVFLHEELFEDAIAAVSNLSSYHRSPILQVMDRVIESYSQWVIDNARPRAEAIMDEGKAKDYDHAVAWLKRVKAAYQAMDNEAEWSRYHQELVSTHGRKRKLMGLFQQHHL
jgi:uncharacterized Zn finger protein